MELNYNRLWNRCRLELYWLTHWSPSACWFFVTRPRMPTRPKRSVRFPAESPSGHGTGRPLKEPPKMPFTLQRLTVNWEDNWIFWNFFWSNYLADRCTGRCSLWLHTGPVLFVEWILASGHRHRCRWHVDGHRLPDLAAAFTDRLVL